MYKIISGTPRDIETKFAECLAEGWAPVGPATIAGYDGYGIYICVTLYKA